MAIRRTPRKRDTQLAFDALSIEGGLLSPDWLARVAQLSAGQQSEADYRIPKGLNLRDEIGRYWRIAQAHWHEFADGLTRLDGQAHGTSDANARPLAERFVLALLRECFGFNSLAPVAPIGLAGRNYPIGFAALSGRVPIVIAAASSGLDAPSAAFGDEGRKRSAFGVAQEYLNAAEQATWGLASDGVTVRVLRDNASLTRPAWIEADLRRIFTEERYADFAALWLLAHETRFGRATTDGSAQLATACALDVWREAGREEGVRAREHLRRGVEEALLALGQGFLSHPENGPLRTALQDGSLTKTEYFQQLLRLVYRLIFLITVEERGLLHPPGASEETRQLYADGYGLRRLRDRAARRSAHDRFADLWEATKIVFRGLAAGEPRLGLPALAGIFASAQCPSLDVAKLENRALLLAVFRLAWLREKSGLARVNWRDMGPEELGSVYESLLELVPQVTQDGRGFAFASGGETKGNARKTSGSYYTHDSLVQVLLDSALEPVVHQAIAAHPVNRADALLDLSIVDPACGSGHFLLAAARRVATHLARLQSDGTPSAAEYRRALRQVVGRCVYGVDLNPMAVELCKVSLWMEAVEPGLPLTFLDSHIQCGNALLGATPELMATGVPDTAWEPIEGDDKKTASALKKRNKLAAAGQRGLSSLWSEPTQQEAAQVVQAVRDLEAAPDADVAALARKESQWEGILGSDAYQHQKFVADAWCAAFVWPKQPGPFAVAAPTNELWRQIRDGRGQPPSLTVQTTRELVSHYRFFHWHLAFPHVFGRGGFDVVLGNPPWDEIQFEETAWFASRDSSIASAATAAVRAAQIEELKLSSPVMHELYCAAVREVDGTKHFARDSDLYPGSAFGKLNTYALFVERNVGLVNRVHGHVGCVAPTGVATDKGTSKLFEALMSSGRVRSLFDFTNERLLFPGIRPHQHFCLLTLASGRDSTATASVAAFLVDVSELKDADRLYAMSWNDVVSLNSEAKTLSLFASSRHAEASRKLVRAFPPLGAQTEAGTWGAAYQQGTFNTASASELFRTALDLGSDGFTLNGLRAQRETESFVPLFDSKMARQYEWRAASLSFSGNQFRKIAKDSTPDEMLVDPDFLPTFAYWVPAEESEKRLGSWRRGWLLGFKDVTGVTSTRLAAFALVPRMGFGDGFPFLKLAGQAEEHGFILAWMNSILVEFFLRQRMQGLHLTWHLLAQVPTPTRHDAMSSCPWKRGETMSRWFAMRAAELSVTSWPLTSFLSEMKLQALPFRYDPERRIILRAEIDAAFFVCAGFSASDTEFVLDFLDKVRNRDMHTFGEYRTKRLILEIYDAIVEAARMGGTYKTRLDPTPADPRVAHPDTRDLR